MYTDSLDNEMEFLLALGKSSEACTKDGDCIRVRECPNCKDGVVMTRLINKEQTKRFEHYCEACGEKFSISKIKAEVFFNNQCWMLKELKTSFGDIQLYLNEKPFFFRYGVNIIEMGMNNKPILINKMSIDLSKLKLGDILRFGFCNAILNPSIIDDDMLVYITLDEKSILGFCLYLSKKESCYEVSSDNKGFVCRIVSDVNDNKNIVFALISLNIQDYENAKEEMILAFKNFKK